MQADIKAVQTTDYAALENQYRDTAALTQGKLEVTAEATAQVAQGDGATVTDTGGNPHLNTTGQAPPPERVARNLDAAAIKGQADVVQGADGTPVEVASGTANEVTSAVNNHVDVAAGDGTAAVIREEGFAVTSTNTGVTEALGIADAPVKDAPRYFKGADGIIEGLNKLGKPVMVLMILAGGLAMVSQISNGDYMGASGTAGELTAGTLLGGLGFELTLTLLAAGPALPVLAAGLVVAVVVGIYGGKLGRAIGERLFSFFSWLESKFGDAYSPDIFVVNRTHTAQHLRITVHAAHPYAVTPPWHAGTWDTVVTPQSTLIADGVPAGALHYQLHQVGGWQTSTGWTIARSQFPSWAEQVLPEYGFSPTATSAFVATWAPLLSGSGSITLYPQTAAMLDSVAPLTVSGAPASVRRLWFYVTPPMPVTSPTAPQPVAAAPVDVQEWGMTFAGGVLPAGVTPP